MAQHTGKNRSRQQKVFDRKVERGEGMKAIERFLQTAYTDDRLAMLLAHAEDGKLSFWSCCCFAGIPRSTHALRGRNEHTDNPHWNTAWTDGESAASAAFCQLARNDEGRCAAIIPVIRAEMARRESLAPQSVPAQEVAIAR